MQVAESELEGGVSAHVSPMTGTSFDTNVNLNKHFEPGITLKTHANKDVRDIGSLLSGAGFVLLKVDMDEIHVGYPSMFELMRDLRDMGESNAVAARKPYLRRETIHRAAEIYKGTF